MALLHKFPRTPHLRNLGAATGDDVVLDATSALALLQGANTRIYIEEKVDGANLGISIDPDRPGQLRFQKRGHWINSSSETQYAKLDAWAARHAAELVHVLEPGRILFGEWLCARHTMPYDCLPDWFLAFDIYDIHAKRYLTRVERDAALAGTHIHLVRTITPPAADVPTAAAATPATAVAPRTAHGSVPDSAAVWPSFESSQQLVDLLMSTMSVYVSDGSAPIEGLYVRVERGTELHARAKLVHPRFTQAIVEGGVHWSKRVTVVNRIRPDLWGDADARADAGNEDYSAHNEVEETMEVSGPESESQASTSTATATANAMATDMATPAAGTPQPREAVAATEDDVAPASADELAATMVAAYEAAAESQVQNQQLLTQEDAAASLSIARGTICVVGPAVDAAAEAVAGSVPEANRKLRLERDGQHAHLSLLTPAEVKALCSTRRWSVGQLLHWLGTRVDACAWLPLGLGQCQSAAGGSGGPSGAATAQFVPVAWPSGALIRRALGLPAKDFHITVGFSSRDVHDKAKSVGSLRGGLAGSEVERLLAACRDAGLQQDSACTAALLLLHSLEQLQPDWPAVTATAAAVDIGAVPESNLEASESLADLALSVAATAEAEQPGADVSDSTCTCGALVLAAAYVTKARLAGRSGDMDSCVMYAEMAAVAVAPQQQQPGAMPVSTTPANRVVDLSCTATLLAAAHMMLGKALYQLKQYPAAQDAFKQVLPLYAQWLRAAVLPTRGAGTGPAAAPLSLPLPAALSHLLVRLMGEVVDPAAARQGLAACDRKLRPSSYAGKDAASSKRQPVVPSNAHAADDDEGQLGSGGDAVCGGNDSALQFVVAALNPRERFTVSGVKVDAGEVRDVTLPRNTSWLVPGQVMGSSTPKSRDQIFALAHLGVRLVITLTEEEPLPAAWFTGTGVTNLFVPTPNYEPPTHADIIRILSAMEAQVAGSPHGPQGHQGLGAVLVHCGGGKGRAGTVLACWMVRHGLQRRTVAELQGAAAAGGAPPAMSASEAVAQLRAMRPGSIETPQQQAFVTEFSGREWQRCNDDAVTVDAAAGGSGVEQGAGIAMPAPAPAPAPAAATGKGKAKAAAAPAATASGSSSNTVDRSAAEQQHADEYAGSGDDCGDGGEDAMAPGTYPRTPHLPFSPQVSADDVQLSNAACSELLGQEVVITEKMDGGNCCIYQGRVYARTHKHEATHPSFSPIKALAAQLRWVVPSHVALFGENMTAVHSIEYDGLKSHLYLFAALDTRAGAWLSWAEVQELAECCGLPTVPVLHRATFASLDALQALAGQLMAAPSTQSRGTASTAAGTSTTAANTVPREGFVVRRACRIPASGGAFERMVAKYVRLGHIQTDDTWRRTWKAHRISTHADGAGAGHALQQAAVGQEAAPAPAAAQTVAPQQQPQKQRATSAYASTPAAPSKAAAASAPSTSRAAATAAWPGSSTSTGASGSGSQANVSAKEGPRQTTAQPTAVQPPAPQQLPQAQQQGQQQGRGMSKAAARKAAKEAAAGGSGSGSSSRLPRLVVLVGLPGSGKSTFAQALAASNPGWLRVCQDECGGLRSTCETEFSNAMLRPQFKGRHVILDRCNATANERRQWLDLGLIGKRDKGVVAVFFNVSAPECKVRVAARTDHPTIPQGRGGRAVDSFAKMLQPPTKQEGFDRVYEVATFEDANALLMQWGARPPAVPAPQPALVADAADADYGMGDD